MCSQEFGGGGGEGGGGRTRIIGRYGGPREWMWEGDMPSPTRI